MTYAADETSIYHIQTQISKRETQKRQEEADQQNKRLTLSDAIDDPRRRIEPVKVSVRLLVVHQLHIPPAISTLPGDPGNLEEQEREGGKNDQNEPPPHDLPHDLPADPTAHAYHRLLPPLPDPYSHLGRPVGVLI